MLPPHVDQSDIEDFRPRKSNYSAEAHRYRLRPVEVDVRRFPEDETADLLDLSRWCDGHIETRDGVRGIAIHTRAPLRFASRGCVILRHVASGECSVLRNVDFEAHYERVYGYR